MPRQMSGEEMTIEDSIELTAKNLRDSYRLDSSTQVEVAMPHTEHVTYLKRYGNQAEIDAHYPNLKLICRDCRDTAQAAVDRLRARGFLR